MDYRRRRLEERLSQQLALGLTVLLVALVQTALLPAPFRAPLNLVLVGMVCWTIIDGPGQGALIAFYGGLALDILGFSGVGSHMLALLSIVSLTLLVINRLPAENWMMALILVGLFTPLYHIVVLLFAGGTDAWLDWARVVLSPAIVVNLLLTLPVLAIVRWWYERQRKQVH